MAVSFTRAMKRFEEAIRDEERYAVLHAGNIDNYRLIKERYERAKKDLREAFDKKKPVN